MPSSWNVIILTILHVVLRQCHCQSNGVCNYAKLIVNIALLSATFSLGTTIKDANLIIMIIIIVVIIIKQL